MIKVFASLVYLQTATSSIRKVNPGDEVLQVNYQTVVSVVHLYVLFFLLFRIFVFIENDLQHYPYNF